MLDLVNTVRWRLDPLRRDDVLQSMADAVATARDVELISGAEAAIVLELADADEGAARRELTRIRRLREAIHSALTGSGSPDPIGRAFTAATASSVLTADGDGWTWAPPADLALVRHRIALAALALTMTPEVGHVRRCDDAHCGWLYVDRSPRHDRRWCDSSDCGNRNRVRRHYERQRSTRGVG